MTLRGSGRPGGPGGPGGSGDPRGKRSWLVTAAVVIATVALLYVVVSTVATGRFF